MQTFNLDLSAKRVIPLLNVKQRDVGTKIQIKLTDNKKEYAIPDGVTWSVWYSGESGEGNYTKVGDRNAVEVNGNMATVELIYQMLDNPGEHEMCLVMNGADGTQLGLWNIPYFVEAIPGADSKAATAYYQAFLDAQAKAEAAAGRAEAAAGQIAVDQEFIETQVFSAGQAANVAAEAARDAAQSERNTKNDADRAAGAVGSAEAALKRTEEVADSVGSPVSYKAQTLSKEQQGQARANIGASTYYSTKREELGIGHEDINAAHIYGLYDSLMATYPNNVRKNEVCNDDGTFTNYEYVISTGEYPTDGAYIQAYGADVNIKKPKYLILSGIHGTERTAVFSAYRFIRDLLAGYNISDAFREGVIISILPVGNPSGLDRFKRQSGNDVDLNRNFDFNWSDGQCKDGDGDAFTFGSSAASEKETQAIVRWMTDNGDAELFIDCHNNGALNEKVVILGLPDNSDAELAKKTALRGIDRIIPFWRDVIGYPATVEADGLIDTDGDDSKVEERNVIFSYSAAVAGGGMAFGYAHGVKGIPSIALETASYYGDHSEWIKDKKVYSPEAVAMGAEALGNILIELYEQSLSRGVNSNMNLVAEKLELLIQSASFRIERGSEFGCAALAKGFQISIPCSANPKLIVFKATEATQAKLVSLTREASEEQANYAFALILNNIVDLDSAGDMASAARNVAVFQYEKYADVYVVAVCTDAKLYDTDTVPKTDIAGFYQGEDAEYEWTAYYWDE